MCGGGTWKREVVQDHKVRSRRQHTRPCLPIAPVALTMQIVRLHRHSRIYRQQLWHAHEVSALLVGAPIAPTAHGETRPLTVLSPARYLWLYIIVLKGFLVYISDIFTAVTMLSTDSWSNAIFNSCSPDLHNGCVPIPFNVGKWLFFGCIIFSFLLVRLRGTSKACLHVDE